MSDVRSSVRAFAPAIALAAALACGTSAHAASLSEGFESVLPAGWTVVNNSAPIGTTSWFQGEVAHHFAAQAGTAASYAAADYFNGADHSDISTWLITPTLSFNNGDVLSFFTRSTQLYPDRLEVRFSGVGGTDVGTTATSVGTFTTLLLAVNPGLTPMGYPDSWTHYSATISGLGGATSGAIAFRYFVTDGGSQGLNSEYIGIDTVTITAVPEPAVSLMLALGLGVLGLARGRAARV